MNFWTKPSGSTLLETEERTRTTLDLPIESSYLPLDTSGLNISLLSGTLPKGMRLENAQLIGTPFEVKIDTVYTFVLRAEQFGHIDDRTYNILVKGPDEPEWVTPEGTLPVGANDRYFIIDSAIIDFQLIAIDPDTSAGDNILYYIAPGDGELPPGISLTDDGRLVGIVDPVLAIAKAAGSGNYDANLYSSYPFDFGSNVSDNGYDSFFYDTVIYDTFIPTRSPKKLNRFYEFIVSAADETSVTKRKFQIYVVGDDFLRADNTIMKVANGVFTADNTYVRTPIWLTPANFGYRRANNYVTLFLDVLDLNTLTGIITYSLEPFNDDNTPSVLPPGLSLDESNGEIAGRVPYQAPVTTEYKFTVKALRRVPNIEEQSFKNKTFTIKMLGEVDSVMSWQSDNNTFNLRTNLNSTLQLDAVSNVPKSIILYSIIEGQLPSGLRLSNYGEIIGKVPTVTNFDTNTQEFDQNLTTFDKTFKFKVRAQDHFGYSAIEKEFTILIFDPDHKLYSNLFATPLLKEKHRKQYKDLINNKKYFDLQFIYRPYDKQFGIQQSMQMLIYAGIEKKQAQEYVAAISKNTKRKKYKLGNIKTAVAKNPGTNDIVYEVVYVDVIDPAENQKGETRKSFTVKNDKKITVDQSMYTLDRFSPEVPKPLGILIKTNLYGLVEHYFDPLFEIEARSGEKYIIDTNPLILNESETIGNLINGPNEPYRFKPTPDNTLKADFDGITIDGRGARKKFISNVTHVRKNIQKVGETEIEFLPLWMRTAQQNSIEYLGFVTAIPLCYCKPGTSKEIITALNRDNVIFQNFELDIDRFTIDATTGNNNEQYLVFHNYKHNA